MPSAQAFCVRDSDPWRRCGAVLAGKRRAERRRLPLKYSPARAVARETPIFSFFCYSQILLPSIVK